MVWEQNAAVIVCLVSKAIDASCSDYFTKSEISVPDERNGETGGMHSVLAEGSRKEDGDRKQKSTDDSEQNWQEDAVSVSRVRSRGPPTEVSRFEE